MTPDQIAAIRQSFSGLEASAPDAARLFYDRLFEISPRTRALFKTDMEAQGAKLMATLKAVVDHLDRLGEVLPEARDMAIRHVGYGVTADDYVPVGAALIHMLGSALGPAFTPALQAAWLEAYATLTGAMIEAAYPESEARRA